MFNYAKEGYPFIAVFAVVTVLAYFAFGRGIWVVPLILTLFMFYFFRDPDRIPASSEGYISPADGRVIVVNETIEPDYIKGKALQISIFMSPLNVHVNRAPCGGLVEVVKYTPGKYLAAYKDDAPYKNENTVMLLNSPDGKVLLRQVAGFIARRTVCRAKVGDTLKKAERFGLIKFSSRVDVYFPEGSTPVVKVGDKVRAGETVIASLKRRP